MGDATAVRDLQRSRRSSTHANISKMRLGGGDWHAESWVAVQWESGNLRVGEEVLTLRIPACIWRQHSQKPWSPRSGGVGWLNSERAHSSFPCCFILSRPSRPKWGCEEGCLCSFKHQFISWSLAGAASLVLLDILFHQTSEYPSPTQMFIQWAILGVYPYYFLPSFVWSSEIECYSLLFSAYHHQ